MSETPTKRFSSRVEHYVKARPGYPAAVPEFLREVARLRAGDAIADVGAGTGILTRLLLAAGNPVYAVEPNAEMRRAAEAALGGHANFHSVDGTAEATGLADHSVRLVTAAQAFHWFDPAATRKEFRRILAADGRVALIWNDRRTTGSPFAEEYDRFLHAHATDLKAIANRWRASTTEDLLQAFFGPGGYQVRRFDNSQTHDFAGLESRVLSSSYMPLASDPKYPAMRDALRELFARHERSGHVTMEYETVVYYGALT